MRKLIAVLSTVSLGLTLLIAAPALATVTAPANGATVHGTVTLSDDGGTDSSWFYCDDASTKIELINSSNHVVFSKSWTGEGARSVSIDTHDYPNGSYKVRGTDHNAKKGGFANLGCKYSTDTDTNNITIRNASRVTYTGPTSAPANSSVTVTATVADWYEASTKLSGKTVSFSLSGGATVTDTTNSSGVASATLPISGPPRNATIDATFNGDSHWAGAHDDTGFQVTKQATKTTLETPADVVHGQATHFTAEVDVTEGTGTPSGGTVQFKVDGSNFGSPVSVSGGSATSASTSSLSTGNHAITAVYSGSGSYDGSTSAAVTQDVNKAQTTTSLAQDVNPTVHGQEVTFTATVGVVAPGAGTPTGDVQFTIDGNPAGTAMALDGDTATLEISDLDAGNHDVVATYNGDANFATSDSAQIVHGVDQAQTEVDLTSSDTSAVSGQPLTFTAEVAPTGSGAGDPSGTVMFFADGDSIGDPVALSGGSATSDAIGLVVGTHEITASYSGDSNFAGSAGTLEQEVAAAATTTTATTSPNPSVFGQPVTARAVVSPVSPAAGQPVGTVKFVVDHGEDVIYADLDGGVAEAPLTGLSVGGHTVVATYLSGDPNFVTSTSGEATQQVNKAATSTEVTSSSPTSVYGQPVTFTATVSVDGPGAGSPSGTVTFTDGSEVLGTAPVSASTAEQASIVVSDLSVAQHAIVATYSGDDSFLGSDGSVTQKVERAHTSTLVTSSANPAESGEAVSFTAQVSPVAPGAGEPMGTVTFTVNGARLGNPVMLSDGEATSSTFATLTPGTYTIEATYSGDGHFVGSSGGLDQGTGLDVVKGATTMTLESSAPSAAYGAPVTFTSTVKAVPPATGRPSGVVQFWEGGVLLGASNLAAADAADTASAEFVTSTLEPGAHAIRAVYVGNFNFEGQTASTSQDIGPASTVTGITATPNPSTFGQDVTLTATVTGAPGAPGTPAGSVTFRDGSTVLGTTDLSTVDGSQKASLEVSGLHGGDHVLTATYSGGGSFAASTSADYTLNVNRAASSIHAERLTSFTDGEANIRVGVVQATLTGLGGEPLAGETVVFTTTEPGDHGVLPVCQAVTDEDGVASCESRTHETVLVLLGRGYEATFEGNTDHLPSTDHGNEFASDEVNP